MTLVGVIQSHVTVTSLAASWFSFLLGLSLVPYAAKTKLHDPTVIPRTLLPLGHLIAQWPHVQFCSPYKEIENGYQALLISSCHSSLQSPSSYQFLENGQNDRCVIWRLIKRKYDQVSVTIFETVDHHATRARHGFRMNVKFWGFAQIGIAIGFNQSDPSDLW